jgi:hypothetical protein
MIRTMTTKKRSTVVGGLILVACLLGFAARAHADVPRPDECRVLHAACSYSGSTANGAGTCEMTTCMYPTPTGTMTADCFECRASNDGGGDGSDASTQPSAASASGCSLGGRASTTTGAALGLAAIALARSRRRRR